ncbi:type I DNA topoisomerase [Candidatus Phytoplasma sacchari]|uniref:DNA topoisomerase 1 n=1 Tax=Candidatus Phytoplasma sacchari TaxID=2609813 RepID=A0ABY7M2M4_9MOLU|nr:type I DNA topoisomerase [Candidatus Phytoplasma sacchari]
MKSKVIIVESPTKIKTLNSYFENKILVLSSKGHIRDLSYKGKDNLGIDIKNNFNPMYQIIPKQKELVNKIIKLTKGKQIFLATDPDREGEAIAWHLAEILKLNLKEKNRIIFNEINKKTVLEALKKPISIKKNLVDSQEARRILDRIIGFKLSQITRKKSAKSAGRVQSVALKLIVEIEEQRKKFIPEKYYLIKAVFDKFQTYLKINKKEKINTEEQANKIIEDIKNKNFLLNKIKNKKIINKSPKPFITATLQQEAFKILSMSAKTTMSYAQKLYEGVKIDDSIVGLITYMRTDSHRISSIFYDKLNIFIKKEYGSEYLNNYKQEIKKELVQDAHEAIRPTDLSITPHFLKKYLNKYELALYEMIYKRTLASFMSNAIFEQNEFFFSVNKYIFVTNDNKIIFDGFYKILKSDFKMTNLSFLEKNKTYLPEKIEKIQKETSPPSQFTEASLIKKLENLKIGRPSTYANIIEILKKRFYVYIEKKKIICTKLGILIKKTLDDFFPSIINIDYTSQIEKKLDEIYYNKISKIDFLKEFYNNFINLWDLANKKIKKEEIITKEKCSLCNDFLVKRKGKYGEFLGCNSFPQCKNMISLKEKKEEIITKEKCSLCNDFLVKRKGKYGEFLGCNSFPQCKNMISLKEKKEEIITKEKCSLCNDFLVKRKGKYGEFLGCNSFPQCKNMISLKEKKEGK